MRPKVLLQPWTPRATAGPRETFLLGLSREKFFEFLLFRMAHSGVLCIFEWWWSLSNIPGPGVTYPPTPPLFRWAWLQPDLAGFVRNLWMLDQSKPGPKSIYKYIRIDMMKNYCLAILTSHIAHLTYWCFSSFVCLTEAPNSKTKTEKNKKLCEHFPGQDYQVCQFVA